MRKVIVIVHETSLLCVLSSTLWVELGLGSKFFFRDGLGRVGSVSWWVRLRFGWVKEDEPTENSALKHLGRDLIACRAFSRPLFSVRWPGGATRKAFGLAISRSRVQILLEATLRNNLRQVVYTYVSLSPSSITWYRPKGGGDALRLGR